jgi:hypothetical protein
MQKRTVIKNIKKIINKFGAFDVNEIGAETSPCVGELGNYVGLAEYFKPTGVQVNVYMPSGFSSDPEDEYDMDYEDLDKDTLEEILLLAEMWEAESLQTEKRISN